MAHVDDYNNAEAAGGMARIVDKQVLQELLGQPVTQGGASGSRGGTGWVIAVNLSDDRR